MVSSDDRPLVRLCKATGGSVGPSRGVQSSRAITVVDSSLERLEVAPAPAAVNPLALQRGPSLYTGVFNRGLPSVHVQESFCTLSEAELNRICKRYKFDLDRFSPLLPLPGQIANDPPKDCEAVMRSILNQGSIFLFLNPLSISFVLIISDFLK